MLLIIIMICGGLRTRLPLIYGDTLVFHSGYSEKGVESDEAKRLESLFST